MNLIFNAKKKRHVIECGSIREASKLFRDFIEKFNLGSSDCLEAHIKQGEKTIGLISYNGRVWEWTGSSLNPGELLYCPYTRKGCANSGGF
jgi:hypothetical protein